MKIQKEHIESAIKDAGFLGAKVVINHVGYITVVYHDIGLNRDEAEEAKITLEIVTGLPFTYYADVNGGQLRVKFRSLDHIR